jgi:hypothetical protein
VTAAPPPAADGNDDASLDDRTPEAVLSRALELTDDEFWEADGDLLDELFRLVDEEPDVLASRLVREARAGRSDRAERLLDQVMYIGDTGALIRATAALDPVLARRWATRCFYRLEDCIEALGVAEAAAVMRQAITGDSESQNWSVTAKEDLWRLPPRGIWEFFFHLHDVDGKGPPSGTEMEWLLAGAPEALFRTDPMRALTPEEEPLLQAHVDGFVDHLLATVAAGIDARQWQRWLRWINDQLYRCHPGCCRPSLFVVAMAERGYLRI